MYSPVVFTRLYPCCVSIASCLLIVLSCCFPRRYEINAQSARKQSNSNLTLLPLWSYNELQHKVITVRFKNGGCFWRSQFYFNMHRLESQEAMYEYDYATGSRRHKSAPQTQISGFCCRFCRLWRCKRGLFMLNVCPSRKLDSCSHQFVRSPRLQVVLIPDNASKPFYSKK